MDIFEFALEKERLAREYYLELKNKTPNTGLQHIFQMLADEEAKHTKAIEAMQAKEKHEIEESRVLKNAKETFEKMRKAADHIGLDISQKELFAKARDIEKHAMDFYVEKSQEVSDSWQKEIFKKLASEERNHYVLMDNICELLQRPDTWLEDAEFYHLEDY